MNFGTQLPSNCVCGKRGAGGAGGIGGKGDDADEPQPFAKRTNNSETTLKVNALRRGPAASLGTSSPFIELLTSKLARDAEF